MKSILISIRPKWCEKIANGEKKACGGAEMKKCDYLSILCRNGWKLKDFGSEDEYSKFELMILSEFYHVTLEANITTYGKQLGLNGDYGVAYIDVAEYENDFPLGGSEIEDMLKGIEYAENNLLLIGCPFCDNYQFHGKNAANKKRKNKKLRKIYGLDLKENAD